MGQAASCNNFTHPVKRAQYQIVAKVDCRGGRGRGKTDCVVGIGLIAAKGDAALPRLCCGQSSVMLRQAMYFLDNAHTDNRLAVLSCHVRWGGRREARGERRERNKESSGINGASRGHWGKSGRTDKEEDGGGRWGEGRATNNKDRKSFLRESGDGIPNS